MKVITSAERSKIAGLAPDGGINVGALSGINVVFTTLGSADVPTTFGGDNAHPDFGFAYSSTD